jgi:hypothetical protein
LKVLTGLEQIRETQTVQGKLLNLLLTTGRKAPAVCQLPTDINLPITTHEEAEALDERMQDNSLLNSLVSIFLIFHYTSLIIRIKLDDIFQRIT